MSTVNEKSSIGQIVGYSLVCGLGFGAVSISYFCVTDTSFDVLTLARVRNYPSCSLKQVCPAPSCLL